MAYLDRLNDVWRVTQAMLCPNGQVQEINTSWQITVQGGGDSRPALLTAIDTLANTFLVPIIPSSCHYYGSRCSYISTAAPYAPVVTTPDIAGGGGGFMMPSQARVVSTLVTDLVGRAYRGRIFGFTPDTGQGTATEHPSAVVLGAWNNYTAALVTGFAVGGTTWTLVLWHRPRPPKPILPPTVVTEVNARGKYGTQRRSGDYGRLNPLPW